MNKLFLLVVTLGWISCNNPKQLQEIKSAQHDATYYEWVSGVNGGGRGLVFQAKFLLDQEALQCDSILINERMLPCEITVIKDTVFANAFFMVAGNPEAEGEAERMPTADFLHAKSYQGKLKITIEEKVYFIDLGDFQKTRPPNLPM